MSQSKFAQFINNINFGKISNLLAQGREMDYIARHYHMDLALSGPPPFASPERERWRAGPPASRVPFNSLGPLEPKECLYIDD